VAIYVFLGGVLPPLCLGGGDLDFSFEALADLYQRTLSERDWKQVTQVRSYVDLQNVFRLLCQQPIDPRGNLAREELMLSVDRGEGLPPCFYTFWDRKSREGKDFYPSSAEVTQVLSQFLSIQSQRSSGFLRFYFQFERRWRSLVAKERAKRLGKQWNDASQSEGDQDLLTQDFSLGEENQLGGEELVEYRPLLECLAHLSDHPMEQYRSLLQFRYHSIMDHIQDQPFSLDYILGYGVLLMLIEDDRFLQEKAKQEKAEQGGVGSRLLDRVVDGEECE